MQFHAVTFIAVGKWMDVAWLCECLPEKVVHCLASVTTMSNMSLWQCGSRHCARWLLWKKRQGHLDSWCLLCCNGACFQTQMTWWLKSRALCGIKVEIIVVQCESTFATSCGTRMLSHKENIIHCSLQVNFIAKLVVSDGRKEVLFGWCHNHVCFIQCSMKEYLFGLAMTNWYRIHLLWHGHSNSNQERWALKESEGESSDVVIMVMFNSKKGVVVHEASTNWSKKEGHVFEWLNLYKGNVLLSLRHSNKCKSCAWSSNKFYFNGLLPKKDNGH